MKRVRISLGVFVAAVLICSFFFSTAHAQVDYTIWEGRWLKVNTNFKGYERNFAGPPDWSPDNERFTLFMQIGTYADPTPGGTEGDETFSAVVWNYDTPPPPELPGWVSMPVIFHRIHGTPLDFFIWSQTDEGDITTGLGMRFAFVARITGRMDRAGTDLQTAQFKCLGGYHVEMDPADPIYLASGITMTGTLVPLNFCDSARNSQYPPCRRPD